MAFSTKHSWVSLALLGICFQHVILSFGQQTERNSVSRNEQLDTQLSPASPPQWYAALTIYTSMCSIVYPIQLNRRCVKLFESIWVWTWNSFRYGILLGLCSSQFRGESVEKSWIKLELIMMRFPFFGEWNSTWHRTYQIVIKNFHIWWHTICMWAIKFSMHKLVGEESDDDE